MRLEISEHPSTIKAHILFQQIEDENHGLSHWFLLALHKLLIERPDLSVSQLINEYEILCPKTMNSVHQRLLEKQ